MQKLFFLIKRMSGNEKKYLVQRLSINKEGKNNYLKLYKAIEKQKEYDEELLKKTFRNEPFVKQIGVVKTRLYNLILHYLGSYAHQNSSIQPLQIIQNAGVLFEKGMYQACLDELHDAQIKAEDLEEYEQVLYTIQQKIKVSMQANNNPKEVLQLIEEKNTCIKKIEAFNAMQTLLMNLYMNFRNTPRTKILENEIILNIIASTEQLFVANKNYNVYIIDSFYYEILASYNAYIGNTSFALEYRKLKLIAIEKKSEHFLSVHKTPYIGLLCNITQNYLGLSSITETDFVAWCNKLRQAHTQCEAVSLKARLFCHLSFFQMGYFVKQKKLNNLKLLLTQLDDNEHLNTQLKLANNIAISFLSAIYQAVSHNLIEKNSAKSVLLLENFFGQYKHRLSNGQIYILRLIIIILYFDTKTYEIIPFLVISLKRFVIKNNFSDPYNILFLNVLAQASIKANLHKQKAIFSKFLEKKQLLEKQDPILIISALYNFEAWVAEKIK